MILARGMVPYSFGIKRQLALNSNMTGYTMRRTTEVILLLIAAGIFAVIVLLTPIVAINRYPFIIDTWEWYAQGLYYWGEYHKNLFRPPLLPFILGIFHKAGIEAFSGLIPHVFFLSALIAVFYIAKRMFNKETGYISVLMLMLNKHVFVSSYYLNPDIMCVSLITVAIALGLGSPSSKAMTVASWAVLALSFYAHNCLPFIVAYALVLMAMKGPKALGGKANIIGLGCLVVLIAVYFLFFFRMQDAYGSNIKLLSINDPGTTARYFVKTFFALGIAGSVLLLAGLVFSLMLYRDDRKCCFALLLWAITFFVFFSVFYGRDRWIAGRFVTYWLFPLIIISSYGLWKIISMIKYKLVCSVLILATAVSVNAGSFYWEDWNSGVDIISNDAVSVPVLPNIVLTQSGSFVSKTTMPALFFYAIMDNETKRFIASRNVLPDEMLKLSAILKKELAESDQFSVVPLNYHAEHGVAMRLAVLSDRRFQQLSRERIDSSMPKILIVIDLPLNESNKDSDQEYLRLNEHLKPEQISLKDFVLKRIAGSKAYVRAENVGLFSVYIRTSAAPY